MAGVKEIGLCAHVACYTRIREEDRVPAHTTVQVKKERKFPRVEPHSQTHKPVSCDQESSAYCMLMHHDGVLHDKNNRVGVSEPSAGFWSCCACTHVFGQIDSRSGVCAEAQKSPVGV